MIDQVFFYQRSSWSTGSHLTLRWKGRPRYVVPRDHGSQEATWRVFNPGALTSVLRVKAAISRALRANTYNESSAMAVVREAIGSDVGSSSWRAGAAGPWSKDTILLLASGQPDPVYLVKTGVGADVDGLLRNEANWLSRIAAEPNLRDYIPRLAVSRFGPRLSFIAQSIVDGSMDTALSEPHFLFLQRFQAGFQYSVAYEQSYLFKVMQHRLSDLCPRLNPAWARRLTLALDRVTQVMAGQNLLMVAAHNDFAPWNIRVAGPIASVFDWEYAAEAHFPLFDPLHFTIKPLALRHCSPAIIYQAALATMRQCRTWLGAERCYNGETQILAYLTNLCLMFLWADNGEDTSDPMLNSYGKMIDHVCTSLDWQ